MGFFNDLANFGKTAIKGLGQTGIQKFTNAVSPFVPIAGGIASNIVAGMNERKAREYNRPINQVKRLREAGLPLAAGSNIQAGGGVSTKVADMGTSGFNQNLGSSISRQIDRKKLAIMQQELRQQTYAADLAAGNLKNQLNPSGKFENTNQGTSLAQTLKAQEEAVKGAEIVNRWMPIEKAQNILKSQKEVDNIAANTRNTLAQHNIILADSQIKNIIAGFQSKMSQAELNGLILRNIGQSKTNRQADLSYQINTIQGEILRETKIAQIHSAQMAAINAGQSVAANNMGLIIKGLETESAKAYYRVRSRADASYRGNEWDRFTPADLMYLKMFTPTQTGEISFPMLR